MVGEVDGGDEVLACSLGQQPGGGVEQAACAWLGSKLDGAGARHARAGPAKQNQGTFLGPPYRGDLRRGGETGRRVELMRPSAGPGRTGPRDTKRGGASANSSISTGGAMPSTRRCQRPGSSIPAHGCGERGGIADREMQAVDAVVHQLERAADGAADHGTPVLKGLVDNERRVLPPSDGNTTQSAPAISRATRSADSARVSRIGRLTRAAAKRDSVSSVWWSVPPCSDNACATPCADSSADASSATFAPLKRLMWPKNAKRLRA